MIKKPLIFVLIAFLALCSAILPQAQNNAAEAKKYSNIYVFMESEPVAEYEQLGTVKLGMVTKCDWGVIRDKLVKKALKDYPKADAIIINDDLDAIAIRFK